MILALLAAPVDAAIYRFTGAAFDTILENDAETSPLCQIAINYTCYGDRYDPSRRITFEFELSGPVPITGPGEWFSPRFPQSGYISPYYGGLDHDSGRGRIRFDSSGNISDWEISGYYRRNADYSYIRASSSTGVYFQNYYEFAVDCSVLHGCVTTDYFTATSANVGSWEIIGAVPLPAGGLLLVSGLGALALGRRFKRTL